MCLRACRDPRLGALHVLTDKELQSGSAPAGGESWAGSWPCCLALEPEVGQGRPKRPTCSAPPLEPLEILLLEITNPAGDLGLQVPLTLGLLGSQPPHLLPIQTGLAANAWASEGF